MVHSRTLSFTLFLLLSLAVNFVGWTQTPGTAPKTTLTQPALPQPSAPAALAQAPTASNPTASNPAASNPGAANAAAANSAAPAPSPGQSSVPLQDSLDKQLKSTEKQWDNLRSPGSFWVQPKPWTVDPPLGQTMVAVNCDPMPDGQLKAVVAREARRNQMSATLLTAVIEQESNRLPCAQSNKGAMGMMQLMPATAADLEVADPWDPVQNIAAGSRYLKQLLDRYDGDPSKALAAYNAGMGRVDKAGGVPDIAETKNYVQRILEKAGLQTAESQNGVVGGAHVSGASQ